MKVKIGKSLSRRSKVDLGFDNSTTASFGHCQPILCKEMVPNSTFDVEVDSLVRLSPLVKPTFGRVKYKVWHNFIPLADIYKPFESMLSQMPFTTAAGVEYIPTSVPQIEISQLSRLFYTLDFFVTPYTTGPVSTVAGVPSEFNLYTKGSFEIGTLSAVSSSDTSYNLSFVSATTNPWSNIYRTFTAPLSGSQYSLSDHWGFIFADGLYKDWASNPNNCDMIWTSVGSTTEEYTVSVYTQKLTDRQRRLRKILLGLGYSLDINNDAKVSMLPLIAYYKAWFNALYPQRYKTWTQTAAYKLMENIADYGNNTITSGNTTQILYFNEFMNDLCDTFYFADADYYSAHLTGTSSSFDGTHLKYADGLTSMTGVKVDSDQGKLDVYNDTNLQPMGDVTNGYVSDTTLRMLRILTKFVNKNTQIGGKIAEYLRVHYGADLINNLLQNYFIGGDSVDVTISDVMSNASTDNAELADYAGKGIGYKDGKNFKFTANNFGYWITFSAIVPRSSWYQGIDPQLRHRERFDYYTPEFDAVGFTLSPKSILVNNEGIGCTRLNAAGASNNNSFGYIPRYSEYKVRTKNIVNGDITLASTRNDLMPYTLDRTFTPVTVDATPATGNTYRDVRIWKFPAINAVSSNLDLRRIGLYAEYGNYDRIFYANQDASSQLAEGSIVLGIDTMAAFYSGIDDNFIVHHIISIDGKVPMIPMSESFDTGGDEQDAMTVDKV